MKKGLKITGITLGAILAIMLLIPFAFQGKIADIVKTEGNKILKAQFDFKDLSISLFKNFPQASVTLENFYLKGVGEFENDTLVKAGEVTAAMNLLSLFGDSGYDISKISIVDTKLHAIVLENGHVNWDIMKTDSTKTETSEETTSSSPFKIKLQQFVIKNMNLTYNDQPGKMLAQVKGLDALCSGDLSSDKTIISIEAETQGVNYKMNGIPFLSNAKIGTEMNVEADFANQKFTLQDNTFRLNAIEAGLDGWVRLTDPAVEMDLKMNTNDIGFKEILSLIPAIYATEFNSLKTEGTATLTASAKGVLQGDTVPAFQMDLQVKDAQFRYPSLPAGVDQINVHAQVQNPGGNIDLTTISIQPFSLRLAQNPFQLTALIETPISDPAFVVEAKGLLDLGMIKNVYPIKDCSLNGIIQADVKTSGKMSFIEKEQFDKVQASGNIRLSDMNLEMKDIPAVQIKKSLFTFTPKYLQLSETTVNMGENDLTADSRFENYMGYVLKGTTLKGNVNIRSKHFNLNDFMTTDSTAVTTETAVADSVSTAMGLLEVPRNIDFQMVANLEEVLFGQMVFKQMNGQLLVKDGKVDMKNLSMNTMGGNVVMNGYYSTANIEKPEMKAGFKLSNLVFAQVYKELDMVKKLAPIFENLKGNFSGHINLLTALDKEMSPVLNSMQGEGNIAVKDLSLSGVKTIDQIADAIKQPNLKNMTANDMDVHFTIKDGRVHTEPFDIKMGNYLLNLSGTTGLDQTIEYSGKIKLPQNGNANKLSSLDLKITGSFTSPKVSVDVASMANQAIEKVKEEAIQKIGEKIGLDSITTANKDSLKQKVTQKALDFLKKKLK